MYWIDDIHKLPKDIATVLGSGCKCRSCISNSLECWRVNNISARLFTEAILLTVCCLLLLFKWCRFYLFYKEVIKYFWDVVRPATGHSCQWCGDFVWSKSFAHASGEWGLCFRLWIANQFFGPSWVSLCFNHQYV